MNKIEKESIIVNDYLGFVSNRISHLMMNEAAFLVQDNVAKPEDIDNIFRNCYGHKMGPLETADLIGIQKKIASNPSKIGKSNQRIIVVLLKQPLVQKGEIATKKIHQINTAVIAKEEIYDGSYGFLFFLTVKDGILIKIKKSDIFMLYHFYHLSLPPVQCDLSLISLYRT